MGNVDVGVGVDVDVEIRFYFLSYEMTKKSKKGITNRCKLI